MSQLLKTELIIFGPMILVNGSINGKGPYQFIVDTGATETVITPPTAQALKISSVPAGSATDRPAPR